MAYLGKLSAMKGGSPDIYRAYEGPETGGFSVLSQKDVPDLGADDEFRRRMLGDATTPPSPFAGTNPKLLEGMPKSNYIGKLSQLSQLTAATSPPPAAAPAIAPAAAPAAAPAEAAPASRSWAGYVPDVFSAQRLGAKLGKAWSGIEPDSAKEAFGRGYVNEGLSNLLSTPRFAKSLEETGRSSAAWLLDKMGVSSPEMLKALKGAPSYVPSGVNLKPEDVRAAPALFPGGKTFEQERADQLATTAKLQEKYPKSYAGGQLGGDVSTLVFGKRASGASGVMRNLEKKLVEKIENPDTLAKAGSAAGYLAKKFSSPAWHTFLKGGGRTAEAATEGFAMSTLNNGDPLEMAAAAGASQGAASFIRQLTSIHGPSKSRILNAGIKAVTAGTALQLLEKMLPGGDEKSIVGHIQSGFSKVAGGTMLTLGLGALGAGRLRTQEWAQLSKYLDDVPTAMRTGAFGLMERYVGYDSGMRSKIKSALDLMQNDPTSVPQHVMDVLSNGLSQGGDAFRNAIERLEKTGEL
jgi:hypothetical protein